MKCLLGGTLLSLSLLVAVAHGKKENVHFIQLMDLLKAVVTVSSHSSTLTGSTTDAHPLTGILLGAALRLMLMESMFLDKGTGSIALTLPVQEWLLTQQRQ